MAAAEQINILHTNYYQQWCKQKPQLSS